MRESRKNNFTVRSILFLPLLAQISACSSKEFIKESSCSRASLNFLRATRTRERAPQMLHALQRDLEGTRKEMQGCFDDFYRRVGQSNFHTCLVVGVDVTGNMDYFRFSAAEINLDRDFLNCATRVTRRIPWWRYGTDYQLVQSYYFYDE